jgi:hypothetical protein
MSKFNPGSTVVVEALPDVNGGKFGESAEVIWKPRSLRMFTGIGRMKGNLTELESGESTTAVR